MFFFIINMNILAKIFKKYHNFICFIILGTCVYICLSVGFFNKNTLEYYKKINKEEQQVKIAKMTDIGVAVLQYAPVVAGFVSKNPMMYANYTISIFVSVPACLILKTIINEERPDDINNKRSFPSGHSTLAFIGASVMIMCLRRYNARIFIGGLAIILAICVAYGRVMAKRHWYIDIIFGSIIGCFNTCLTYLIIKYFYKKKTGKNINSVNNNSIKEKLEEDI